MFITPRFIAQDLSKLGSFSLKSSKAFWIIPRLCSKHFFVKIFSVKSSVSSVGSALNSNNFHMKLEKENLLKNVLKLKLFFFHKIKRALKRNSAKRGSVNRGMSVLLKMTNHISKLKL